MRGLVLTSALVGLAIGAAAGIGGFTFLYANGLSYMTNDPAACNNCHVMNTQFDAWAKSSHKHVAVCNDCHAPHDFLGKYYTKALNGYLHSYAFTTGDFHEPIRITERNRRIAEASCRSCHEAVLAQMDGQHRGSEPQACLHCHGNVGHPGLANVGSTPWNVSGDQ